MTDFLDVKRGEITARLKELAPLVDEYRRLEAAASALTRLGAAPGAASTTTAPRRGPGRPRGSGKKAASAAAPAVAAAPTTGRKKVGRPPGSGKKVGRPAGTGKKVGRPPGSGKKVGRPAAKPAGSPAGSTKVGRPPGRPAGRVGRRKGSGTRAAQALSFVQGQPGITIPELAAKMGIKQNYLYRVLPGLEQEGKLEKKGRGWHPKS
ncbi:MAG TPA: hypothetical protein VGL54_03495 [Solirubrobacteraceae bacterium]